MLIIFLLKFTLNLAKKKIIVENYDYGGAVILKKYSIVTVCMIVVIATDFVLVFLHTERDQDAVKNSNFKKIGKKVFGSGLADTVDWVIRNTGIFFLALLKDNFTKEL